MAFPSYNIALGFWGAYCAFSRHGRATFGYISFGALGILLDIIFCSTTRERILLFKRLYINMVTNLFHSLADSLAASYMFSLVMLVFCMVTKVSDLKIFYFLVWDLHECI